MTADQQTDTEAEAETPENQWAEETKGFSTPGSSPAKKDDDEGSDDDDAAAAKKSGDKKADAKEGGKDKQAQADVEGNGKDKPLSDWMTERVNREKKKTERETLRADKLARKVEELEGKVADLSKPKDDDTPAEPPDPDDYDTTAEYEAAKRKYKAADQKKKDDAKAETKTDKKADPKKGDAPELPSHIDPDEFTEAMTFIRDSLSDDTNKALGKLPSLSHDTLMAMYDLAEGDAEEAENIAAFAVDNPEIISAIDQLPVRRRSGSLERAYLERDIEDEGDGEGGDKDTKDAKKGAEKPKGKQQSKADPPIDRSKGGGRAPKSSASADDFSTFEAQRNAEEIERRGKAY